MNASSSKLDGDKIVAITAQARTATKWCWWARPAPHSGAVKQLTDHHEWDVGLGRLKSLSRGGHTLPLWTGTNQSRFARLEWWARQDSNLGPNRYERCL